MHLLFIRVKPRKTNKNSRKHKKREQQKDQNDQNVTEQPKEQNEQINEEQIFKKIDIELKQSDINILFSFEEILQQIILFYMQYLQLFYQLKNLYCMPLSSVDELKKSNS